MSTRRILQLITGIITLAVFAFCVYRYINTAPKGSDYGSTYEREIIYLTPDPESAAQAEPSAAPVAVTPAPTATPEPTPEPDSPAKRARALGLPEPPDVDVTSWELMLANGENSISEYVPENPVTIEGQRFDGRIADALNAMTAAARAAGCQVYLSSGYRSYSEQAANFTRVCNNNGITDGKNSAGYYITMPAGCSEHQTGLCCDITDVYYATKSASGLAGYPGFVKLFNFLTEHCAEYGFILRFPDGRQSTTGVMYESWHYRYVGVEAATYIMENNLCLEDFLQLYPEADGYTYLTQAGA